MFERFTEPARQVVVLAQEEARAFGHNYIGTEHILLGLLRDREGLAARALESFDVTLESARAQVTRLVGSGEDPIPEQHKVPFTPRAKKGLELALREALNLGRNYIGPEHLLLGLLRGNDGVAARILLSLDADADRVREELIRMLPEPPTRTLGELATGGRRESREAIDPGWFNGLGGVLSRLAVEIRNELGRDPDVGDLLLVLACGTGTLASQALGELAVDIDALQGTIERLRDHATRSREELLQRIRELRRATKRAIEAQELETVAGLQDEQRKLVEQASMNTFVPSEALRVIRKQLGLPAEADGPPRT